MVGRLDFNHGKFNEDNIEQSLNRAFAEDFVFRSPHNIKKKEHADHLVLFDDSVLVFQAKSEERIKKRTGHELNWAAKHLRKAYKQIKGSYRALDEGRIINIKNQRLGEVKFERENYPFIYGLIIIDHKSQPYNPYEICPELKTLKYPVDILSYVDFRNLCFYLDTPADLITYLEYRANVLIDKLSPKVHLERDIFEYYLENLEQILKIQSNDSKMREYDINLYSKGLRDYVFRLNPDAHFGSLIDEMINKSHDIDPDLPKLEVDADDVTSHITIATQLAKMNRIRRIEMGKLCHEKVLKASETNLPQVFGRCSRRRNDCFVFYACPRPFHERKQRMEELLAFTHLGRQYFGVELAMGVATEGTLNKGRSHDFIHLKQPLLTLSGELKSQIEELGKNTFGEYTVID